MHRQLTDEDCKVILDAVGCKIEDAAVFKVLCHALRIAAHWGNTLDVMPLEKRKGKV